MITIWRNWSQEVQLSSTLYTFSSGSQRDTSTRQLAFSFIGGLRAAVSVCPSYSWSTLQRKLHGMMPSVTPPKHVTAMRKIELLQNSVGKGRGGGEGWAVSQITFIGRVPIRSFDGSI